MLWIAIAFIVAMMIGFLIPRKPLKLNLNAAPKQPGLGAAPKDPFAAPPSTDAKPTTGSDGTTGPTA